MLIISSFEDEKEMIHDSEIIIYICMNIEKIELQQEQCCWCSTILFICFCVGLIKAFLFIKALIGPFLTRRHDLQKRYGGGWALITGGSQGIGLAIAEELAKESFDIILVSRSKVKLQAARERLQTINPKIQIETSSIDFEKITTEEEYAAAFKEIMKKDISILVNNVGYYAPYYFANLPFEQVRRQMKINCLPVVILSHLFLPKFLERKHRSGVINLSSGAAMASYAGSAHYSATKKLIDFLSQSVGYQCLKNVDTLTARPYIVSTPMTRNAEAIYTTTADKCAKHIVDSLGHRSTCYGPFIHNLQGVGAEFFHAGLTSRASTMAIAHFVKLYQAAGN